MARPFVIDPDALTNGLRNKNTRTAIFDPFYEDHSLAQRLLSEFDASQLVATPHIAALTFDARNAMAKLAVQSILNVLRTGTDPFAVNN